jgi:hypothetical protein
MAPWAVGVLVRVRVQKADGTIVDISEDVRTIERAEPIGSRRGRQNETDTIQPGNLQITIDNSSGNYTPGRSTASCELTLNMPVFVDEGLGYRTFPVFTGLLQVPETVEQMEGVDNLITVTAVDRQQALAGGKKFISTLAEYILSDPTGTLLHFYPLTEAAAPFRDVVGDGAPFEPETTRSSLAGPNTGPGTYTPNGGVQASGDDVRGVAFEPATSTAGGLGFGQLASGYMLSATFATAADPSGAVQVAAGEPLTLIAWVSLTDEFDDQVVISFGLADSIQLPTQVTTATLSRVIRYVTAGADAGLLQGRTIDAIGGGMAGVASSPYLYPGTGGGIVPIAMQVTHGPNSIRVWIGNNEYVDAAPTGALASPQYVDGFTLGPITGSLTHFQVHVGSYARTDYLAQWRAGQEGLAGQRTDERIATILSYAAGDFPHRLDEGSTFMQPARLAGLTPGQAIDTAVTTERGRFFIAADGVSVFHARTRAYNL